MSPPAVSWVFDESPYRGAFFALHVAIADRVNDKNGYELWESVPNLALRARISERHAREGVAQMIEDGLLTLLKERRGATTVYRFEMPANPCTTRTPERSAPLQQTAQTPALSSETPATTAETPALAAPELNNRMNSRGNSTLVGFDAFMRAYPLQVGHVPARIEWGKAIRKKNAAEIIAAALAYSADPTRKDKFTMQPARWLKEERWNDERCTRTQSNGTKAGNRLLERAGVIDVKELGA